MNRNMQYRQRVMAIRQNRWVVLGLAWLIYAYFGGMAVAFAPILVIVERDLHTTNTGGGFLLGAYPLMYVLSAFGIGRACDRFGVRTSTCVGILILAVSMLIRSAADSLGVMLCAAALLGVGGPVVSTILPKLVAERFDGSIRTIAAGIYVTGPALGAATVLGLTTRVLIPWAGSWRLLYLYFGFLGLILLAVWFLMATESNNVPSPGERVRSGEDATRQVWQIGNVWMVVLVGVVGFAISQGFSSWVPSILEKDGFSINSAGSWASIARIVSIPASLAICAVAARMRARNARSWVVMVLLGISATSIALVALHTSVVPALVLQGAAAGALLPLLMAILMDLPEIRAAEMATAAALYFTVGQVAGAGAPILIGWIRDATGGFSTGMLVISGMAVAGFWPAARLIIREGGMSRQAIEEAIA